MSAKKWDGLSDTHKKAIRDAGQAAWDRTNTYAEDHAKELAARQKLEAQGVEWLDDFPAADRAVYIEAVNVTWEKLADEAGGDAPAYRKRVLAAMGR